jgi:hypothetical protein
MSISHPASVLYSAGLRTYSIKYFDDGFQVLYDIRDVDIDYLYFPKFLPASVLEGLDNRTILEAIAYTGYDEELDVYEITQYEDMSRLVRSRLYDVFYGEDGLGYTRERAIEENASYGYTDTYEQVGFQIAIDVRLTETGVTTSIIQNSIVDSETARLANVSLYPHFATAVSEIAGEETDGYIVIPDGSGAVIEFNNGKYYQQPYSKRLYGPDLGIMSHKMPEQQQKISVPVYGMVKEDGAYTAIITSGDTMATINADVSGRTDSYNKVYPTFHFREYESITLGSGFNVYGIDLWTEDRVDFDFTVDYRFLEGPDNTYVDIAEVYEDYLFGDTSQTMDTTNETVLTTEIIGSYDQKSFIFGVPHYTSESLTTFDETKEILQALLDRDITNINVVYRGMINGGLSNSTSDAFKIERILGGKKGFNSLQSFANGHNIDIYPLVRFITTSEYNKMFDSYRYTSRRIDGSLSMLFTYHLPSKLPQSETPYDYFKDDYIISPLYYQTMMNQLTKDYSGENITFDMFGSVLSGDYNDTLLYKQATLQIEKNVLQNLELNTMLSSPLGFALPYADYVTDLPMSTTLYALLDYQIPFVQLVLSGHVDYSTVSLNMENERGVEYNFLKAIETGSNIKYTLSYDDSKELRETEFNYYISTQYTNWINRITEQVEELDEIGIHQGTLIGHERLANNVYKVTYSHGLVIMINYNLSNVVVDTKAIGAMSYRILEVN